MSELPKCDQEIAEKGTPICVLAGGSATIIEAIIEQARKDTGERIDWHYAGGRAVVLTLCANLDKIRDAIFARSRIRDMSL